MEIPVLVEETLFRLEKAGFESYVVGGCVRDTLLGREPQDWDICTAARPEEIPEVFPEERVIPTGARHGTVTLLARGEPVEITTFRTESCYSDGRHPDRVEFVSNLHEDLSRRDFTINALAYSPLRGLRDDFGGRQDIAEGILRCVGEPAARFQEDALRILRALRFAARFGFTMEGNTAKAVRESRSLLKNVSHERIFTEIKSILTGSHAGEVLLAFPEVFFTVIPEMEPMLGLDQRRPTRHQWDVWGHTAHAVSAVEPDEILRLTMFFHDCGKPQTFSLDPKTGEGRFYGHPEEGSRLADTILERLRCDNFMRETVTALVANHEMRSGHSKKALRRRLSRLGEENMHRLMKVRRADAEAHTPETRDRLFAMATDDERILEELLQEEGRLTVRNLAIGGKDLLALGIPQGEDMGKLLKELLDDVIEERLPNEKMSLLAQVQNKRRITKEVEKI